MELLFLALIILLFILRPFYNPPQTDDVERPEPTEYVPDIPKQPESSTESESDWYDPTYNPFSRKPSGYYVPAELKQEYMTSHEWYLLKQQRLAIANHQCEVKGCTEKHNLHLHHVTYKRLLNEHINDLRIVCGTHHQAVHDKLGYDRTTEFPIN